MSDHCRMPPRTLLASYSAPGAAGLSLAWRLGEQGTEAYPRRLQNVLAMTIAATSELDIGALPGVPVVLEDGPPPERWG